jgi:hypothetical protein
VTTLLSCANCSAPLPPPANNVSLCKFCNATNVVRGGESSLPKNAFDPTPRPDPLGAKALALDFAAQHGFDITGDAQAMERLGVVWAKASKEVAAQGRTTVSAPFLASTPKDGAVHYSRELDAKTMESLLAVAKKLG